MGQKYDAYANVVKNEMLFHSILDKQIKPGGLGSSQKGKTKICYIYVLN